MSDWCIHCSKFTLKDGRPYCPDFGWIDDRGIACNYYEPRGIKEVLKDG